MYSDLAEIIKNLADSIKDIKESVQLGAVIYPKEFKLIKEMRDNLDDIIVEDMYR